MSEKQLEQIADVLESGAVEEMTVEQLKRIADALERMIEIAENICEHFGIDYGWDWRRGRK